MRRRDAITIRATPAQAWPFIADPVLQAAWNPKIVSIDRPIDGPVKLGDRFDMLYRMARKEHLSRVEVIDVTPNKRIVFRHRLEGKGVEEIVTETYELQPKRGGVRVKHLVDLTATNIPLFIRPLLWLISTFGKPVDEPQLSKLKRLIESEIG